MQIKILTLVLLFMSSLALPSTEIHADWANWRGPHDHGVADTDSLPADLGESNTIWIADLPGKGCSTPIVQDEVIYLTAPVDGKDALLA